MKRCHIFDIIDPDEAWMSMNNEIVERYGSECNGHYLFTWDDGDRMLARCKKCGAYILIQRSEFHSMFDDDSYYRDYFPVSGPEEARMLNQQYSGWGIEKMFTERYLMRSDGSCSWSKEHELK